jgi:hypothetical protein
VEVKSTASVTDSAAAEVSPSHGKGSIAAVDLAEQVAGSAEAGVVNERPGSV